MNRQRAFLAIAVVGAVVCGSIAFFGGIGVAVNHGRPGESLGGAIVAVGLFVVATLLFIRWAVHAEHRLRGNPPLRQAASPPSVPRVLRATGRGRRQGPVAIAVEIGLFVAGAIGFTIGGFVLLGHAHHSQRVQHHGIETYAQVVDIDNIVHHGKNSTTYTTARIAVHYSEPVQGVSDAVVHYPRRFSGYDGERLQVLADPADATYAEIAGSPNVGSAQWIITFLMALFFGGFGSFAAYEALVVQRHKRSGAFDRPPVAVARPDPTTYDPGSGLPAPD